MKLDQFVAQTLVSIVKGIQNATKQLKEDKIEYQFLIQDWGDESKEARYINFDVAVSSTTEISGKAEGVGDIVVASLNLNTEAKRGFENVSRVKFKVLCR